MPIDCQAVTKASLETGFSPSISVAETLTLMLIQNKNE